MPGGVSLMARILTGAMRHYFAPTAGSGIPTPVAGVVERITVQPGIVPLLPAAPGRDRNRTRCTHIGVVQVPQVYPTTAAEFPDAAESRTGSCGSMVAAAFTLAVYRCGYTMLDDGKLQPDNRLDEMFTGLLDDEERLRYAACRAIREASEPVIGEGARAPVILSGSIGPWEADEVEGGWFGGSREVRVILAKGWK